jgi:hypothetical protein
MTQRQQHEPKQLISGKEDSKPTNAPANPITAPASPPANSMDLVFMDSLL